MNYTIFRTHWLVAAEALWLFTTLIHAQSSSSPSLAVVVKADQTIDISWPASAQAAVLEQNSSLGQPASWQAVTQSPLLLGDQFSITVNPTEQAQFYRLRLDQGAPAFTISGFTPLDGATDVGVTFRPQISFSQPINPATLGPNNFYASFGGQTLPATVVPANDGSFAWLFFQQPMPGGARVRITVDGSRITAAQGGSALDAAGAGTPGGVLTYDFTTVSLAPLAGTSLSGIVVDPGPDLIPRSDDDLQPGPDGRLGTADDVFLLPIEGVKVHLLGLEDQVVMTGADGRFHFDAVPGGDVKVVLDGNTASHPPADMYFPEMVIDAQMTVGIENHTMTNGPEVYLPRLAKSILQTVSSANTNLIQATPDGAPNLSAFQRNQLSITVAPNSLIGANGQTLTSGQIGISTVPSELVRDMLPPGVLQHTFDITIQAPGIATFSTPAPMSFPNVFNAAPGTKLNFLSFDHTTGRLVIEGTATVSADGASVRTDPGTGVTHPGWHGLTPPGGPNDPPCDPTAPHDLDVTPIPVAIGVNDYLFKDDSGVVTWSFGNAANKQIASEDPCNAANIGATPLVISFTVEGPFGEFLRGPAGESTKIPDLVLLPGQQSTMQINPKALLTPQGIAQAQQNVLYGAKIKIEGRQFNSARVLYLDRTVYLYRLFDIADADHTDGRVDFENALRDDRGGIRQTRSLLLKMPDSVRPVFSVQDNPATASADERLDFFVEQNSPTELRLVFDPVSGLIGGPSEAPLELRSPNGASAGKILLRGQGVAPQIILFAKAGFQSAMAALIDQSPLPANIRAVANLFPADSADPGVLRSDEAGFPAVIDTMYRQLSDNIPTPFLELSSAAGANAPALSVSDLDVGGGQLIFSSFFNTNLPGGTTLCGKDALACATWADFYTNMFPSTLRKDISWLQHRWLFASLINRSYSDPNSASGSSGSQAVTLYLDVNAQDANSDASTFVPQLINGLVHEIGHNLGAIHLRSPLHEYVWGNHDVMGFGEPDRHKLAKFRTFAPIIKLGLGLPVTDPEFKSIMAYYKKYVGREKYGFDVLANPTYGGSDAAIDVPVLAVFDSPLVIGGTPLEEVEEVNFPPTISDGPGGQVATTKLYLVNNGGADLTVNSVRVTGDSAFSVNVALTAPVVLPALDPTTPQPDLSSFVIELRFDPGVIGAAEAVLEIQSDQFDEAAAVQIPLHGTGLPATGSIAVTAPTSNLGGVQLGASMTVNAFARIQNVGTQPLQITGARIGRGEGEYTIQGFPGGLSAGNPLVIAPADSFTFDLAFAPGQAGLRRGEVQLLSSDPKAPVYRVLVVGTGLASSGNLLETLDYGNDYVAMESPDFPNGPVLRAKTDAKGNFSFFLPPGQRYHAVIFDPVSGLVAHLNGITASSGQNTPLGMPVFLASTAPDSDGEGLPDDIEFAIGTDPNKADTDGDGIDDFVAVLQGVDPLGGRAAVTGIIAQVPVDDYANDIVVTPNAKGEAQLAYVADYSGGLVIVDVTRPSQPKVAARLALRGKSFFVSVDPVWQVAAVAADSFVHLVDVSDPQSPKLIQSYPVGAPSQVAAVDGYAYFEANYGTLYALNTRSGIVEQHIDLPGNYISSVVREGDFLYIMDSNYLLRIVQINGAQMSLRGSLQITGAAGRFVVANGIAYIPLAGRSDPLTGVTVVGGYATFDVSDPDKPVLITNTSVPAGTSEPGAVLAMSGSGFGLILGTAPGGGGNVADLLNVSDPKNTYLFLTRFLLPERPYAATIASGTAFIADGAAGLVILNYQTFDMGGQAPAATISAVFAESEPTKPSVDIIEGSRFQVQATIVDDAQVRTVELLVNGQVVKSSVAVPWELAGFAPDIAGASNTFVVQVRATDTSGNVGISPPTVIHLLRDTTPPVLLQSDPAEGDEKFRGLASVILSFSEPLAGTSLTSTNFEIIHESGLVTRPTAFTQRDFNREVELTIPPLDLPGNYRLVIHAATVTDGAANPLGRADITRAFSVWPYSIRWNRAETANWFTATNWVPQRTPIPTDWVYIGAVPTNAAVHLYSHNLAVPDLEKVRVRSLVSEADLVLLYCELQVDEPFLCDGSLYLTASKLTDTVLVAGPMSVLGYNLGPTSPFVTREGYFSVLDGVTLRGDLEMKTEYHILNRLTVEGNIYGKVDRKSGFNGLLHATRDTVIQGPGTFHDLPFEVSSAELNAPNRPGPLVTIGSDVTFRGALNIALEGSSSRLINRGKLLADDPLPFASGRYYSAINLVGGVGTNEFLINEGTIQASNGYRLLISGAYNTQMTNHGVLQVDTNSFLWFAVPLVSPKVRCEAGAVVQLSGRGAPWTTDAGQVSELSGPGRWLAGETEFRGGTIRLTDGAILEGTAVFNGVTFEGELHNYDWNSRQAALPDFLLGYGNQVQVLTNMTLNGLIAFHRPDPTAGGGLLFLLGAQSRLDGQGHIEFEGPSRSNQILGGGFADASGFLTIGPNITIHGQSLTIGKGPGNYGQLPFVENQGTILTQPGDFLSFGTYGFTNSGVIHIAGTNQVNVQFNFDQTATGRLEFEASNPTSGPASGQLSVAGTATLDGALKLSLIAPFQPAAGDSFGLLTYPSVQGRFTSLLAPPAPLGLEYVADYGPQSFLLRVGSTGRGAIAPGGAH